MTMLETLNFTDKTRDAGTSPEGRLRQKLLAAIDLQIERGAQLAPPTYW